MSVDTLARGADSTSTARTYGGWRRVRDIGLWGLGPGESAICLTAVVVPLLLLSVSVRAALLVAPVSAVALAVLLLRVRGVPVAYYALGRARWAYARWRGWTSYVGGVLVDHPGAWQLPGVLAPTRLLETGDGRGGSFGLVWDRRSGALTATLLVAANSTWLVDGSEADVWVANWHAWLATLGYQPTISWVAVSVDTAPEPGTALRDQSRRRVAADAPADALSFIDELVEQSPAAAADVITRVSVTFDTARAAEPLADITDHASFVARALVGIEASLAQCGVTVHGRASAAQLAGMVRQAFDPTARGEVTRALSSADADRLLTWPTAGPVSAEEQWGAYRHDSGWSVSWAWHEAPRQQVTSGVLTRLLAPGKYPRRVTLLYRPLPAGTAADVLERQVNATAFRTKLREKQGMDATARDADDRHRALRAAREEAEGAGVVNLTLYVTATVVDEADLAAAVADVEERAEQSRVRLRRLWGGQSVGFATTLPAGIHPAALEWKGRR